MLKELGGGGTFPPPALNGDMTQVIQATQGLREMPGIFYFFSKPISKRLSIMALGRFMPASQVSPPLNKELHLLLSRFDSWDYSILVKQDDFSEVRVWRETI